MNRPRFILAFLAFFSLFPFILDAREASDIVGDKFEETVGRGLSIRTSPAGVKVFIDNVERGLSPVSFNNLTPGEYSIRLTREGYRERRFNVVLFSNSRLEVSIEMEEERGLALVSIYKAPGSPALLPFSPQIFTGLSGETNPETSLSGANTALLNLPAGYRTIRVRAFGWEDATAAALISEHETATVDIYMKPAAFKLERPSQSRRRFNPKDSNNLGITEYRFEVSAPGSGNITITDKNGAEVYKKALGQFTAWNQTVSWDGKTSSGEVAQEGIYTVTIEASALAEVSGGGAETSAVKLETEINYSISIFPLSLFGGIPGLDFAPLPNTLSAGSFQVEGGILFGSFREQGALPFSGLPFEIGLRVTPVNKLEISAVFNANPHFENSNGSSSGSTAGWGITGSLKYNIIQASDKVPLSFAAGASYAFAREDGEAPLSPGRGIGLYAPLSLELAGFSFIFSPGAFWRGPQEPAPALLLCAGVLYRGGWFSAGVSLRPQLDFSSAIADNFRLMAGAQAYFYPPPSNLVFSFRAGIRRFENHTGGYGGLGIGFIH